MKKVLIVIIRFYQLCLSPLFPQSCRFYPTCSQYTLESIEHKGCSEGLRQGFMRLLRCHPFHPGGYDPPRE